MGVGGRRGGAWRRGRPFASNSSRQRGDTEGLRASFHATHCAIHCATRCSSDARARLAGYTGRWSPLPASSWACTQAHVCPRTRMVAGPATHLLATAEAAVTEPAHALRGQQGGCAVGEEGGSATHPHDVARCSPAAAAPQPLLSTNTVTAGDVQHIVVGGCG